MQYYIFNAGISNNKHGIFMGGFQVREEEEVHTGRHENTDLFLPKILNVAPKGMLVPFKHVPQPHGDIVGAAVHVVEDAEDPRSVVDSAKRLPFVRAGQIKIEFEHHVP